MGKLKLMTIIGTRPEIIRLSATIKCCDRYFEQNLDHTGQNYDNTLNQVFFDALGLRAPDYYLDAVGDDLGATIGNIIEKSYKLMVQVRPDAVLVLGDTNSCLSVIGAKRLHTSICTGRQIDDGMGGAASCNCPVRIFLKTLALCQIYLVLPQSGL